MTQIETFDLPRDETVSRILDGNDESRSSTNSPGQSAFLLTGDVTFGPFYSPKRISVKKDRELNRQENFCGGEDVTDLGSKNREMHISGRFLESELAAFEALLDNTEPLDLTTPGWTGQIMVSGGEYEGPLGRDGRTRQFFFGYSIDVVSTGRDEEDGDAHYSNGTLDPYDTNFTERQLDNLLNGRQVSL
jgi:hypothetical protein